MNKIILIGNNVKDPEIKQTKNNKVFTTFTIAVSRRNREEAPDFINCIAWEKTAELISMYVKKGSKIGIVGRLQIDKVEDKHYTKVIVEEVEFLSKKDSTEKAYEELQSEEFKIDVDEEDADIVFN